MSEETKEVQATDVPATQADAAESMKAAARAADKATAAPAKTADKTPAAEGTEEKKADNAPAVKPTFEVTDQISRAAKSLDLDPAKITSQEAADIVLTAYAANRRQTGRAGQTVQEAQARVKELEDQLAAAKTAPKGDEPTVPSDVPTIEELEEEYGEKLARFVKPLLDKANKVGELEQALATLRASQGAVQNDDENKQWVSFDKYIATLPNFKTTFGEGATLDPKTGEPNFGSDDPELLTRTELLELAAEKQAKRPRLEFEDALELAFRELYPQEHDKRITAQVEKDMQAKVEARKKFQTPRPSGSAPRTSEDQRQADIDRAERNFAKVGAGESLSER